MERARQAASQFEATEPLEALSRYGCGHIHQSYLARYGGSASPRHLLLQRINTAVFPEPLLLMENVRRVTEHLARKAACSEPPPLTMVPTRDGGWVHRDAAGEWWRAFHYIEGTTTFDEVDRPDLAREAGRAFGRFQVQMADLPAPRLHEILPGFHDTPARFEQLRAAIHRDVCGRCAGARKEIERVLALEHRAGSLQGPLRAGRIPERLAHNDTKINNVLISNETTRAVCVVDLDTVMPGSPLFDFGDMMRTATCRAPEDERDLARVKVDEELFQALAEGYLGETKDFLSPEEGELLVCSGVVITLEVAARFLADHLAGDVYFHIRRQGHNLDRCRAQLALLDSMAACEEGLHTRLERILAS